MRAQGWWSGISSWLTNTPTACGFRYEYGIHEVKQPQRGDVMVFHFPKIQNRFHQTCDWLLGIRLPIRANVAINGKAVRVEQDGSYQYVDKGFDVTETVRYQEFLAEPPSDDR